MSKTWHSLTRYDPPDNCSKKKPHAKGSFQMIVQSGGNDDQCGNAHSDFVGEFAHVHNSVLPSDDQIELSASSQCRDEANANGSRCLDGVGNELKIFFMSTVCANSVFYFGSFFTSPSRQVASGEETNQSMLELLQRPSQQCYRAPFLNFVVEWTRLKKSTQTSAEQQSAACPSRSLQ